MFATFCIFYKHMYFLQNGAFVYKPTIQFGNVFSFSKILSEALQDRNETFFFGILSNWSIYVISSNAASSF